MKLKKSITFSLFLNCLCIIPSIAQQEQDKLFFNEISISATHSFANEKYIVLDRVGFSIGCFRNTKSLTRSSVQFGICFDYLPEMTQYVFTGGMGGYTDYNTKYRANSISIPISWHYNLGKNKSCFFEIGGKYIFSKYSLVNLGAITSFGKNIPLKKCDLTLRIAYHHDLIFLNSLIENPTLRLSFGIKMKD